MSVEYYPVPPRVWSRVQNRCVYTEPSGNPYSPVYIPLTKQTVSLAQANYEERMQCKGNILQYKGNSSRLTKSQKYAQLAKGFGPSRTKCFATQSQTYTNPNTNSLWRENYANIPISGNSQNPFGCPSNSIPVGGNLVCGSFANPCTNELIKYPSTEPNCSPSYCSDVPGPPINLCWNPRANTWFPRNRYIMSNSGTKWPQNYKGLVSAVTPKPPILYIYFIDGVSTLEWKYNNSDCMPITNFSLYVNNNFLINLPYYVTSINFTTEQIVSFNITAVAKGSQVLESRYSNTVITTASVCNANYDNVVMYNGVKICYKITNAPVVDSGLVTSTTIDTGFLDCNKSFCDIYNNLVQSKAILQIKDYLQTFTADKNSLSISFDMYNSLKVQLYDMQSKIEQTSCLYEIVNTFKDILAVLWQYISNNNYVAGFITQYELYKIDSEILNNVDKLRAYLQTLNKQFYAFDDVNIKEITKPLIKQVYINYHALYGIPDNLEYDPAKLIIAKYHELYGVPKDFEYDPEKIDVVKVELKIN